MILCGTQRKTIFQLSYHCRISCCNFNIHLKVCPQMKKMQKHSNTINLLIKINFSTTQLAAAMASQHRVIKEERKSGNITGEIRIGPIRP